MLPPNDDKSQPKSKRQPGDWKPLTESEETDRLDGEPRYEVLKKYGFTDKNGHPLENCFEYRELISHAHAYNGHHMILVQSIVSAFTGEPIVSLDWHAQKTQLTPKEAREHALLLLAAADAAERDAAVANFFKSMPGGKMEDVGNILYEFRKWCREWETRGLS